MLWEPKSVVALATNDDAKCLQLYDIRAFEDSLQCRLHVRSGPFSADAVAEFDNVGATVGVLRRIHADLAGELRLGAAYQDTFVAFSVNRRGQLHVAGAIITHSELTQRLEFAFVTDQTALPPFIDGLERVLREDAG